MTVNTTYGFGSVAHATCADAGSGIDTCTVPDPLDTTSVGLKTIHAHAVDRAGNVFDSDLTYRVTAYTFTGFFSPINNLPAINDANAGSSVPIKLSSPASAASTCYTWILSGDGGDATTLQRADALTGPLRTSHADGFTSDPLFDQYTYVSGRPTAEADRSPPLISAH